MRCRVRTRRHPPRRGRSRVHRPAYHVAIRAPTARRTPDVHGTTAHLRPGTRRSRRPRTRDRSAADRPAAHRSHRRPAPALDVATANAAALLAELTLTNDDPSAALPWARWACRSLRRLRGATSPEARGALKVLAIAYRRTGKLPEAADCCRDLIRHHTLADGPRALPTLAAQATLALVLYQDGHCAQARQLLARATAEHRAAHPGHRDGPRLRQELARMRANCVDQRHGHPAGIDDPPHDFAAASPMGAQHHDS
ncbi:tetratricopeptide repeat protein [Micromonospora sp. NPDC048843]|uniref:tetratricopeptide repeat protein n=1 Tax=Micromonospora sp. NPDC048843 TaxID=3155389 RepID=UPI0033F02F9B